MAWGLYSVHLIVLGHEVSDKWCFCWHIVLLAYCYMSMLVKRSSYQNGSELPSCFWGIAVVVFICTRGEYAYKTVTYKIESEHVHE